MFEGPLPGNIFLPETPEKAPESLLMSLLQPELVFLAGGVEDGLMGKLLLFSNDAPNLQRLIGGMLDPMLHECSEQILAHPIRGML